MVFTTERFVVTHPLLCVLVMLLLLFSIPLSIVITSLGEERADICAFRVFICLLCTC